ncbi:MAG: hypothetical protein EBS19_14530 [Spirochaetia bacterium]|nr:hypothetical protein [Spirochaetia bacterium]
MKDLLQFFRDKSLLSALLIIILAEISLQFGCYKKFLKKNSYAWSVNHITDTAVKSLSKLKPNTLIMGTSIAYEGLSPEILNEKLSNEGLVFQSLAIPGSELVVQELALRKILDEPNEIKYIIHVNELQLPWVDRLALLDSSLSMIAEFNRIQGISRLHDDEYELKINDYFFLLSGLFFCFLEIMDMTRWTSEQPPRRTIPRFRFSKNTALEVASGMMLAGTAKQIGNVFCENVFFDEQTSL